MPSDETYKLDLTSDDPQWEEVATQQGGYEALKKYSCKHCFPLKKDKPNFF